MISAIEEAYYEYIDKFFATQNLQKSKSVKFNSGEMKTLFSRKRLFCFINSRVTNGVLNAIFPFWAKMKIVITASCDDLCGNFLARNLDHKF